LGPAKHSAVIGPLRDKRGTRKNRNERSLCQSFAWTKREPRRKGLVMRLFAKKGDHFRPLLAKGGNELTRGKSDPLARKTSCSTRVVKIVNGLTHCPLSVGGGPVRSRRKRMTTLFLLALYFCAIRRVRHVHEKPLKTKRGRRVPPAGSRRGEAKSRDDLATSECGQGGHKHSRNEGPNQMHKGTRATTSKGRGEVVEKITASFMPQTE